MTITILPPTTGTFVWDSTQMPILCPMCPRPMPRMGKFSSVTPILRVWVVMDIVDQRSRRLPLSFMRKDTLRDIMSCREIGCMLRAVSAQKDSCGDLPHLMTYPKCKPSISSSQQSQRWSQQTPLTLSPASSSPQTQQKLATVWDCSRNANILQEHTPFMLQLAVYLNNNTLSQSCNTTNCQLPSQCLNLQPTTKCPSSLTAMQHSNSAILITSILQAWCRSWLSVIQPGRKIPMICWDSPSDLASICQLLRLPHRLLSPYWRFSWNQDIIVVV